MTLRHPGKLVTVICLSLSLMAAAALSGCGNNGAETVRIGGNDRYETAVLAAEEAFPRGKSEAIVVTGKSFPDALSASAYAGAHECPILLSKQDEVPECLETLLTKTWKQKVKKVTFVGGGFDTSVYETLEACGVEEFATVSGTDRCETARLVCETGLEEGVFDYTNCVVATSQSAADALSVSPWCYSLKMPILLCKDGSLSEAGKTMVSKFQHIYIVGGEESVNDRLLNAIKTDDPSRVTRISGSSRYETSRLIAEEFSGDEKVKTLALASGSSDNFADALCGAMLAGRKDGPLRLISPDTGKNAETAGFLKQLADDSCRVYLLGGSSVLPDEAVSETVSGLS